MNKTIILAAIASLALTGGAFAQKSIHTGSGTGAYAKFCQPIPGALTQLDFKGYQCRESGGTLDNITKVLKNPTDIGSAIILSSGTCGSCSLTISI